MRLHIQHVAKFSTLFLSLFTWACSSSPLTASSAQRFHNAEFGFSVTFPPAPIGGKVCVAQSGGHLHGFFAWYGGDQACERTSKIPTVSSLSIYADYNINYEISPNDELLEACQFLVKSKYISPIELKKLAFEGRKSASCAIDKPDGSIEVEVVTQAGKWPNASDVSGSKTPRINYDVWLRTYPDRVQADLILLKKMLKSVEIKPSD